MKINNPPACSASSAVHSAFASELIGSGEQCALFAALGSVRMLSAEEALDLVTRIQECIAQSGIQGIVLRYEIRDLKAGSLITQSEEMVTAIA